MNESKMNESKMEESIMEESIMDESKMDESKMEINDLEKGLNKLDGYSKIIPNNNISNNSEKLCACGCTFMIFFILYIPFIACDLYYSYNEISCQNIVSPNMDLTIGTWLKVNGYLLISLLFMPVFMLFADDKNKCIITFMWIILMLIRIFVFSWLIVGAILFWRDIEPMGKCGKSVDSYIWARLIMGIIGFIIALKSSDNNKNKK
jgi:hypothetical protein